VRFGIYVVPNQPWSELERRWALVEELGFDAVWDCDDLSWSQKRGAICFDGLVVLAAMAARTKRLRVGTLMLSLPIRDNPAVLAKEIIALDHLSNGRLEFGFGAGILEGDHTGAGHEFWAKEERVARFREAVEIVDRALREEMVSYAGNYYRTKDLWTSPGPVQSPRPPPAPSSELRPLSVGASPPVTAGLHAVESWTPVCEASACPTRTSPTPPPVTPAASPWPPWCAASRTSAAARRSRTPSPAVLRVTTRTGEELEARVEVDRGSPGNPLSDEELARKFHDNAVRSLPEERAAELAARTLALPDAQSVEDLTALLTSAGER